MSRKPTPKESTSMRTGSFDLIDRAARVAGDEALPLAIQEQVQVFQHNGANQGILAFRLDHGRERAIATQDFDVGALGGGPSGAAAVGVPDADLTGDAESKLFDHQRGQHKSGGP